MIWRLLLPAAPSLTLPPLQGQAALSFSFTAADLLLETKTSKIITTSRLLTRVARIKTKSPFAFNRYCAFLRRLCRTTRCSVLSCNYSLAPEHPFPCGLGDCFAAVTAVMPPRPAKRCDAMRCYEMP